MRLHFQRSPLSQVNRQYPIAPDSAKLNDGLLYRSVNGDRSES